jgi:hypothetical protein
VAVEHPEHGEEIARPRVVEGKKVVVVIGGGGGG